MKKSWIALALATLVALPALAAANPPTPGPLAADPELQRLRQEIAAAKLDRLLDLNRDQARQLLPLLKEGQALLEQARAEQAKRKPQVAAALTQIRDEIRTNGVASEAAMSALKQARGDGQRKEIHVKMRALREKARAITTPDQIARLAQFDPRPAGRHLEADESGYGGPDQGPGAGPGHRRGMRHGGPMGGRHQRHAMATVVSPEFIALVEARAR